MMLTMKIGVALSVLAAVGSAFGAGLRPLELKPLRLGSIRPEGWLKVQLEAMTEGLCGRLHERTGYLNVTNGWLTTSSDRGWEEQPYWLRGFVKTAVLTENERMLAVAKEWVGKILATQDEDGWFGPRPLKGKVCKNGKTLADIWGHMVMSEALLSWYDYTGDRRIVETLLRFYRHLTAMDETRFIPGHADQAGCGSWTYSVQATRAGDLLPSLFACYELTHEAWLLDLAHRVYRHRERAHLFLNHHNVNFAQAFGYGTLMSRLTGRTADRDSASYWLDLQLKAWGATPRCGFTADENVRNGCTDPRYGMETCGYAEFIRSFVLLGEVTGDAVWGDRAEDVMFNWYPISFTPGWKEVHYITAGNQVNLDARTDHDYCNGPPMVAYSASDYRCCLHNASFGLPQFCESLVMRDGNDALCFWLYAPHRGETTLADGSVASWRLETQYPFRETARLTANGARTLRFRLPGWSRGMTVKDGGRTLAQAGPGGGWLTVTNLRGRATLDLELAAETAYRGYPRHGGVSVERGPLTYSLALRPVETRVRRPRFKWDEDKGYVEDAKEEKRLAKTTMRELTLEPGARWNFALDVTARPVFRTLPFDEDCFRFAAAPCEITVRGRELPEWTLQDNQPAALQDSPAYTTRPPEDLRLIPMCCARLHLTVFPEATTDAASGNRWTPAPPTTLRKDRPTRFLQNEPSF